MKQTSLFHGVARVTRLWTLFVLGWLVVLIASGIFLVQSTLGALDLAIGLTLIGGLGALYLWVTLRLALGPGDFDPEGPPRSQVRTRLMLISLMTLLVIAMVRLPGGTEIWWLIQHVVVAAGLALPAGLALWVMAAETGLALLLAWSITGRLDPILLMLLAFGAAAIAIRQLTINVAQLRIARDELARTAVDQERLRFARDLHDLLGHTLSLVILKSELAGRLLPGSPDLAAGEIRDVERSAREALQQVRTAVAGYRQPVLARELAAAGEMLAAADIDNAISDSAGSLPPALDGLLAWAVREGVTNVIRHSRAHRCDIRVSRREQEVELEVTDDGRGSQSGLLPPGSGLNGLVERTTAHGATMTAGAGANGGFRLLVRAPFHAGGEETA